MTTQLSELTADENDAKITAWFLYKKINSVGEGWAFEAGFQAGLAYNKARVEELEAIIQALKNWRVSKLASDKASTKAYFREGISSIQAQKMREQTKEQYKVMIELLEKLQY